LTLWRPYMLMATKKPKCQSVQKTWRFGENVHTTKDQVDVKNQNQLNLFFETKNLFKKECGK